MKKIDEIFLRQYVSDTETKIPDEKKKEIVQTEKEISPKAYISDTETKIPDEKKTEVFQIEKEMMPKEDIKIYGISKPQRFLIKGKIIHD